MNDSNNAANIRGIEDLSVINACLIGKSGDGIKLTPEQLILTDDALERRRTIWEVETGLGKTYMVLGKVNSLVPEVFESNKKIILVAPTNKYLEFAQIIKDSTILNTVSSSGQQRDVVKLMKNWDSIQVAVLTPSIWTSSLEFNCFIYNHRADVLACIWDEANGVEDTGYLNFIELARTVEYSSFLNATPVGSAGESGYNNDSLKVAYNMLRGIRKFNEKYNTFFNKYTLSSGVSSNNGNTIFNINTDKYNADFGRYILNLNREDLGVAVSFSEVNFHRCGQTEIQKEYISSGYNIKQVLYSPETAGAFELSPANVPALSSLLKILERLPEETNKIVYVDFTKCISILYEYLGKLGYKVLILDGAHTPNPRDKGAVEDKFNESTGYVLLTNIERAGNLGSAGSIIIYDTPADILQYIARATRGYKSKTVTLDWIYYPEREMELMMNAAERTLNNLKLTGRTHALTEPLLKELTSMYKIHPKLKVITDAYYQYISDKNK